jgi:hypothetical protein
MGKADAAYRSLVPRWTAAVVHAAVGAMRPARLCFGTAETSIGVNRRELRDGRIVLGENPGGTYDPTVCVLRVEEEDGRPLACWFSHGTHPVVMGPRNTGLSAEWPGAAAETLRRALGCPAVFAQGCGGDVNPRRRGEYPVVRSVGREAAGAALALPQRCPTVEEAEAALAAARERAADEPDADPHRSLAAGLVHWAEAYLAAARAGDPPSVRMDVQAIRLGDVAVVGTAAETFVEIGRRIAEASPLPRTVPLGYTNGCFGYLPTEKAFPEGGYEVEGAFRFYGTLMVTPECERLTLEAAVRVLRAVAS